MTESDKDHIIKFLATSWGTFFFLFGMSYFVTVEDLKTFAIYLGEVYYNSSVSIWYLP
jgi:hypothetical protein